MFDIFFRKKKPKPEPTFKATLAEIESFKNMLTSEKCPGCEQTKLSLLGYERGSEGFEAKVACTNCSTYGVVNPTGFHFVNMTKLGVKAMPLAMR